MLSTRTLFRYGLLGVPLAFAGLPIYVHVGAFYSDVLRIDLRQLGILLLVLRLGDAVLDPVIGAFSDRFGHHARWIMAASIPVLIVGYIGLFNPSLWAFAHPLSWLTLCLIFVYLGFSSLMINYYALGAGFAGGTNDHTKIATFREAFMLVGVLIASILPSLFQNYMGMRAAYGLFGCLLAPLLIALALPCLSLPRIARPAILRAPLSVYGLLALPDIRWLFTVGFFNAIPAAITSTLFLFFTRDILHSERQSGPLLAFYFLSAACAMPFWTWLSIRMGKRHTLLIAMTMAVLCFATAATLGAGDIGLFAVICFLSGLSVGADLLLFPSLLGDALTNKSNATATGYGVWNFITKLTLALASGIVLPALGLAGYHPTASNSPTALSTLSFCYALLPCLFKAVAIFLLYVSPIDQRTSDRKTKTS